MIFFITNRGYAGAHQRMSVEDSLSALSSMDIIGVDTETTGLDPHKDTILSLQLGNNEDQYVIDCTSVDIENYRPILENKNKLLLLWNAKFDLQFFFKHKIVPYKVWDGYVVEQLMHLGLSHKEYSASLKTACKTYLGVDMDKTIRGQINWKGLSDDVITYAAGDVEHLERIMDLQKAKLAKLGLTKAVPYENKFVIPLAYMEYCGIRMDTERWKAKMAQDAKRRDEALLKCNMWIVNHFKEGDHIWVGDIKKRKVMLVWINREGNLWTGYDLTPQVGLNWNSTDHMTTLFNMLGVDTSQGIEADLLKKQKDKCSLIPLYVAYKEAAKATSAFGQNFLDQLDEESRIHTRFHQFGTKTGRISSGGKDGSSQKVNLLNLPRDAETRACFVSNPGNKFVSIDYSGQESFIMADITGDKAMLDELNHGEGDMHTLSAKMLYDIPKDMKASEVKKKFHDERQQAKTLEFAVFYGSQGRAVANKLNLSNEEASELYEKFMDGFSGLRTYQDFRRKDWTDKGYILINKKTGHKSFVSYFSEYKKDAKEFSGNAFWNDYRARKKENIHDPLVQRVREFSKRKSGIERNSINYPVQGTGALCMKTAMVNFFEWLRREGLLFKVLLCVMPYDEVCFEAPDAVADKCANKMRECMVKSGAYFVTKCSLDAEISYDEAGKLPNYWIH